MDRTTIYRVVLTEDEVATIVRAYAGLNETATVTHYVRGVGRRTICGAEPTFTVEQEGA